MIRFLKLIINPFKKCRYEKIKNTKIGACKKVPLEGNFEDTVLVHRRTIKKKKTIQTCGDFDFLNAEFPSQLVQLLLVVWGHLGCRPATVKYLSFLLSIYHKSCLILHNQGFWGIIYIICILIYISIYLSLILQVDCFTTNQCSVGISLYLYLSISICLSITMTIYHQSCLIHHNQPMFFSYWLFIYLTIYLCA